MKRKWGLMAGVSALNQGFQLAKRTYKGAKAASRVYAKINRKYAPSATKTVTTQHDISRSRGPRKASKKKLKRQKRFRNKIQKALAPVATHHTYTEIMQNAITITKTALIDPLLEQYVTSLPSQNLTINAGSGNGVGITAMKDFMHSLFANSPQLAQGAQPETNLNNRGIRVLSSKIDLSLTNPHPTVALIYDVYWCVATITEESSAYATPQGAWETILASNNQMGSGPAQEKTVATNNGVTPSSSPGFGKYWKVLTKQRIYLQAGATSEMTFNGGGYYYNPQKFAGQTNVAGFTKGLLIVGGIGDNTGVTTTAPANAVMRYHTTRKYRVMYPTGMDQVPNLPTNTTRISQVT